MERECLDGGAILGLPSRASRATNLTLLTIFRDPIERIGSQAFYGSTAINNRLKRGDPKGLDRSGFVPTSFKEAFLEELKVIGKILCRANRTSTRFLGRWTKSHRRTLPAFLLRPAID